MEQEQHKEEEKGAALDYLIRVILTKLISGNNNK